MLDGIAAGTIGPATRAERSDQRKRLASAIAGLQRDEREAMLMRHFEGLDIDRLAERIGSSATSTRRLLGRATLRLGEILRVKDSQP